MCIHGHGRERGTGFIGLEGKGVNRVGRGLRGLIGLGGG